MSNLSGHGQLTGIMRSGGSGGTSDYSNLTNKPKINNVELEGNKTTSDLNISYEDLTNKPTIRNVPDSTGVEIGSVLTHTSNGDNWNPVPKELPTITASDEGKVLGVSNSSLKWVVPSDDSGINYSTNEQEIGTWINGNKLYQKTFVLDNITVPTSGYAYDITSLNIDDIIESPQGFVKISTNDERTLPFNLLDGYGLYVTATPSNIVFEREGSNINLLQIVVTIRYTKTN